MKIITGRYGGRRFDPPRDLDARPTTDLAKQALFNILQNRIELEDCRALDLFSGTGSISFELLSRGASFVVSVEKGRQQQKFIQQVATQLKVSAFRHQLIRGDVFRYLSSPPTMAHDFSGSSDQPFDIVFADPPYDLPKLDKLPDLVLRPSWITPFGLTSWLAPDGIFILEHGKDNDFSSHPNFQEVRTYGAVHFSFFTLSQRPS
ncbi:MAG: RsmD family RNA methyltransferase [Bacteroidales bacterium]|nr:RsmD family RNA methyltransferase [Bacteroidales bacterium]